MPFCQLCHKISSTKDRSLKEREGRKCSPVDQPSKPRNRVKKRSQNPSICLKLCQWHVWRFYQTSIQGNSLTIHSAKENFTFCQHPCDDQPCTPKRSIGPSHHSLSTDLSLRLSPDFTKFLGWSFTLLKYREGWRERFVLREQLLVTNWPFWVHGWSSQGCWQKSKIIDILWQIFVRRVDWETILSNRCLIESSNTLLAEFEADWRILATLFGSISRFAWMIDWWAFFLPSLYFRDLSLVEDIL